MTIYTYQLYRCAREDINKRICALDTRIFAPMKNWRKLKKKRKMMKLLFLCFICNMLRKQPAFFASCHNKGYFKVLRKNLYMSVINSIFVLCVWLVSMKHSTSNHTFQPGIYSCLCKKRQLLQYKAHFHQISP